VQPSIGVFLPYESPPASFGRLAEDAGFDRVASGEHVLFRRPILNAFVALTAVAAATERIRVLTALTLLPLYPPALAAKLASSLDVVSAGRLDLGVGVGGEVPEEFDACGVDVRQRGRLADEALAELARYFDAAAPAAAPAPADQAQMLPKPVQQPRPPIWIGGRSDAALRRAARFGDVWLPYLVTPEHVHEGIAKLRRYRDEAGATQPPQSTQPPQAAVVVFAAVGRDGRAVETEAKQFVSRLYNLEEARVGRYVVAGDAATVVARLTEFVDAGANTVLLNLSAESESANRMTRLLGDEVVPAIRLLSTDSFEFG
jgi:alkanesulfonate monooxygenase SsuD/methylene tetrahydromethanopterin reductase-like flavin-dependent oxidoreductase (luciferase family)